MTDAITLDGSTQYGTVNNYAALDGLTDWTVETWIYRNDTNATYAVIASMGDSGGTVHFLEVQRDQSGVEGLYGETDFNTTNAFTYKSSGWVGNLTWGHIAYTYTNSDQKIRIYVNGTELASYNAQTAGSTVLQSPTGQDLHLAYDLVDFGSGKWKGNIGGFFRVWNVARTITQLNDNKALKLQSANETGLIANFNFNEGAGTTISNEYSAGNIMNLTGTPSWTSGPTTTNKQYASKVGSLLSMFQ